MWLHHMDMAYIKKRMRQQPIMRLIEEQTLVVVQKFIRYTRKVLSIGAITEIETGKVPPGISKLWEDPTVCGRCAIPAYPGYSLLWQD